MRGKNQIIDICDLYKLSNNHSVFNHELDNELNKDNDGKNITRNEKME